MPSAFVSIYFLPCLQLISPSLATSSRPCRPSLKRTRRNSDWEERGSREVRTSVVCPARKAPSRGPGVGQEGGEVRADEDAVQSRRL